ncbi:MAG: DegV family protein, partial [Halanaerobiales bacterium]
EKIKNEFENIKIKIIDSRAGSGATGLIVYKAAQLLSDNIPLEKVVKAVKFWAEHIEHLFILDDLKQLQKGGRISKTKSFIGNILNIKPILHVKEGKIELLQKSRGTKKAINELIKLFKQKSYNIKEQLIAVTHADDLNKAQILKKKIEDLGGEVFFTEMIGGVLGTHLGIRGVGIFFFNKKWE